jgi:hypothetical protein
MSASSLAQSPRFKTFALVFAIVFPVLYLVSDVARLPLFTYHPGPDLFEWGWAKARRDEGPAMYWYGWLATSSIGASSLGLFACILPARLVQRLPLALAWIVPLLLTPWLVYSLKFYWRW